MTSKAVGYAELADARRQYIEALRRDLSSEEHSFLISIKQRAPDWSILGLQGIDKLPSLQWKLANLAKMMPEKHVQYLQKLKNVLQAN